MECVDLSNQVILVQGPLVKKSYNYAIKLIHEMNMCIVYVTID